MLMLRWSALAFALTLGLSSVVGAQETEASPPAADTGADGAKGEAKSTGEAKAEPASAKSEGDGTGEAPTARRNTAGLTLHEALEGLDHTGTPSKPKREGELPSESAAPGEKRPMPNYDNRAPEPMDAADVMVWVPRIMFYPIHLIFEWGVRWPVVQLITLMEKYKIIERVTDLITWDEGRAGFFPRFATDFGLRPHVGISFYWNEVADNNDFAASISAWGDDLIAIKAGGTHRLFDHDTAEFSWHGGYVRRPDNPYYGKDDPNDRCRESGGCRYRTGEATADVSLRTFFEGLNRFTATLEYKNVEFNQNSDSPALTNAEAASLPGFVDGYNLLDLSFKGEIDTRDSDIMFQPGTGLRLELDGAFAVDPANPETRFFRWGGEAAGFWDFGHRHLIAARLYMQLLENIGDRADPERAKRAPIPFTELLTLGGAEHMRGFLEGNLRGRHAWTATVEYRYPVHALLDTSFFVSMGNAFRDFRDWDVARNYLNYGLAFRTNTSRDVALQILIAFGSNRLDSPSFSPVDTFRFALGINHGF